MAESDTPSGADPRPHLATRAEADRAARQAREAAALRENLRKRKLQARVRIDDAKDHPAEQP